MSETQTLASYVLTSRFADIPADVRHEASRALVNYVGCALGGSGDEAVDIAIRALAPYSGKPVASVLGPVSSCTAAAAWHARTIVAALNVSR